MSWGGGGPSPLLRPRGRNKFLAKQVRWPRVRSGGEGRSSFWLIAPPPPPASKTLGQKPAEAAFVFSSARGFSFWRTFLPLFLADGFRAKKRGEKRRRRERPSSASSSRLDKCLDTDCVRVAVGDETAKGRGREFISQPGAWRRRSGRLCSPFRGAERGNEIMGGGSGNFFSLGSRSPTRGTRGNMY